MEQASKNRLQFVHHDECFPTREAAKQYVEQGQTIERPSLYAEPMILKYGDVTNPNIILAIGSVGDGSQSLTNKTFFIDIADINETIQEIADSIDEDKADIEVLSGMVSNIINSCGLTSDGGFENIDNDIVADADSLKEAIKQLADYVDEMEGRISISVEDTNTVDLTLENGVLKADSVFPLKYTFDGRIILDNQLNGEDIEGNRCGHFINVDLKYEGNGSPLQLLVNGSVVKEVELPQEIHVVSGVYDQNKEAVILDLSDSSQIEISLERLAAELMVETPRTSPVELKITRVGPTTVNGQDEYKSILSAKVYVSQDDDNIVEIQDDGESDAVLYVKGTADNIKYGNGTVADALESLDGKVAEEASRAAEAEAAIAANVANVSGASSNLQSELDNEMYERQAADDELNQKIGAISGSVDAISGQVHTKEYEIKEIIRETSGAVQSNIEDVDKHRTLVVSPVGSENLKLTVDDSTPNATYINGYVKVLDSNDNIIEGGNSIIGGALYATAKLSYSPKLNAITFETSGPRQGNISTFYLNNADLNYDTTTNTLKYTYTIADSLSGSTMATKEIKLNSFGVIDHIDYDRDAKEIIIYYEDEGGTLQHITVPVGDLFNEVNVENTQTITLNKERQDDGSDLLTANVNISQNDGNMITSRNDGLYVPSSGIAANAAAIAELSGKTADNTTNIETLSASVASQESRIEALEDGAASEEGQIESLAERVAANEQAISTLNGNAMVEGSVAKSVADALAEAKDYTDEKIDDVTLEGSSAITVDYASKKVSLKINSDLNGEGYLKSSDNGIYVSGINDAIASAISGKADSDDVYTKAEADAKFATKEETSAIDERLSDAETNISTLESSVASIGSALANVSDKANANEQAITTLNSNELVEGSVAYTAKQYADAAKQYTDEVKDELDERIDNVYTKAEADAKFAESSDVESLSQTVESNTSKITELSASTSTILDSAKEYTDAQVAELRQEISGESADISALRQELIATSGTLQTEIDQKADADDVYAKDEVYNKSEIDSMIGDIPSYGDEIEALSGQVQTISGQVQDVNDDIQAVSGSVGTLSGQVQTISGDVAALSGQVQTISGQVESVSGTAQDALDLANEVKLKYNWIVADSPTVDLTKSESTNSGSTLTADVKISTASNNALKADTSGLFVGLSKLTYSAAGNELTFTNANGESAVLTLNSVDVVKSIYYDGASNELVFVYTAEGVEKTTRIDATAFFKGIFGTYDGNVKVETYLAPSGSSQNVATAITANLDVERIISIGQSFTKYVQVEFRKSDSNTILGYVGISTLPNNVLTKDNENELFVPQEASNYTCIYSGETKTVQEAIADLERNIGTGDDNIYRVVGVSSADTSISSYMSRSNYLRNSNNVVDALLALDDKVADVADDIDELHDADALLAQEILDLQSKTAIEGIDTNSTDITVVSTSARTDQPITIQVDVKLSEQNITDEGVSPRGENVMQILNDGLYFGGIIDCGTYDEDED